MARPNTTKKKKDTGELFISEFFCDQMQLHPRTRFVLKQLYPNEKFTMIEWEQILAKHGLS